MATLTRNLLPLLPFIALAAAQAINGGSYVNGRYCPGDVPGVEVNNGVTTGYCCVAGNVQSTCAETVSLTASDYDARISSAIVSLSSQGIVYAQATAADTETAAPTGSDEPSDATATGSEGSSPSAANTASATGSESSGSGSGSSSSASGSAASASKSGGAGAPVATGGALLPFGLIGGAVLGLAAYL